MGWMWATSFIQCLAAAPLEPFDRLDLPNPQPEIRRLLDRGPLRWDSGVRPAGIPATSKLKTAAETTYRIRYSYQSRANWKVNQLGNALTIKVRFKRVQWKATHRIWFRNQPPFNDFWGDRIVRHELDHLRISSDPRHAHRFQERLRQESVFRSPIRAGDVVNKALVDRLVEEHVDRIFQDQTDLIAIRYRELDRVTAHGRLPVPQDSPIAQLLTASAATETD